MKIGCKGTIFQRISKILTNIFSALARFQHAAENFFRENIIRQDNSKEKSQPFYRLGLHLY